jgi:hypothetical protein
MGSINWIYLAQDKDRWRVLVNTVMNLRDPSNAVKFLSSSGCFSFSGRTLLHGVGRNVFTARYEMSMRNSGNLCL